MQSNKLNCNEGIREKKLKVNHDLIGYVKKRYREEN